SFAQERPWFLDRLEPGSPRYNLTGGLRMLGALDVVALERALSEIVRRHAVLRTAFVEGEKGPEQRILAPEPVVLEVLDLGSGDEPERMARLTDWARVQAARP